MAKLTTQTRLRKQLKKLSQPHSGWLDVFPAILGKADGTVLTGISGVVWVRNILNGQQLAVHNNAVPNIPLLQVEVGKRVDMPGLWQIKGTLEPFSTPATGGGSGSVVGEHHTNHEFPSSDTVWVDRKQIKHLTVLVSDASNFIVKILGGIMLTANGITKIATQTVDLSSYVPATGAVFVSIESDDDGVITVNAGTGFDAPTIATVDDIPSPAAGKYTRAYVILYEGQTALSNNDIVVPMPPDFNPVAFSGSTHNHDSRYPRKWTGKTAAPTINDDSGDGYAVDDIWVDETNDQAYIAVDVTVGAAVWVEMGGGSGSGHTIQDEGTPITNRANLNFVGGGVTATDDAGNNATVITIPPNLTTEEVQDIVGDMVNGGTETGIAVTYDDATGKLFFVAEVPQSELDDALDAVFAALAVHDHVGGDGAQIDHGGLAGLSDDDHTQYIKHALATAANDFLVASGSGAYVKKTLAETITILRTSLDSVYAPIENGSSVLGATFSITGTAGTFQDTGLSVTLPSAGTYRVTADVNVKLTGNAGTGWWITLEFYNSTDAAAVANSERLGILTATTGVQQQIGLSMNKIITVAASKVIKLYAARNGAGSPSWTASDIASTANGRTEMSYQRIG